MRRLAPAVLPFLLAVGAVPAAPSLQSLIDAAPSGSVLRLEAREYAGPIRIDKPLTLDGGGRATIRGNGRGTVVAISGTGVTLRGLAIAGSGDSHDSVDAGILVEGRAHRIEENRIEDTLFGIHLRGADDTVVRANRVVGKARELGLRGDAIRVWNGSGNRIEGNDFRRARDLTFINAPDNRIAGNRFGDGRYALHAVFSPRLEIADNHLSRVATGIVVLYSPGATVRANRIEHALDGGGAGIVFRDSGDALVEGNLILHCSVGLKVDAPPEPVGVLEVRGNRFAHNIVGLFFYGEAGGHRFVGNRFDNNLTTVAVSAVGAGAANRWEDNRWDEYAGFDRDGDGVGDTPHEIWLFSDRIWMETPPATFFRNTPLFELIDFLERLAPFAAPHRIVADPRPDVRRAVPNS